MKYLTALLFLLAVLFQHSIAQPLDIYQKAIDSALLVNAHAVKKYEQSELIVYDIEKAVYKSKQVYTILDAKGESFLWFVAYTDRFRKLEDFSISTYNSLGIPVKSYTKKDLEKDASNSNLADDVIYYHLRLSPTNFPFTAELNYTLRYKGIINYPSFDIQDPGESVMQAQYKATVPTQIGLRYFNQYTDIKPKVWEEGENTIYAWEINNLQAFKDDDGSVRSSSKYPRVLIAPNQFKMDDFAGDMTSWQNFGKWYGTLITKTLDLSENTKTYMRSLVSHTTDTAEKTRIIYQYLQDNFRYVSIQLGIGGFRPFPASFTDTKKYGDCKGLSNYMQACLAAVNVKSYQALVNAGTNQPPVNKAFPCNEFTHMILCVPMAKDSIWLECTSSYTDFNKPGSFTENRNALLITEDGGVLVPTPTAKASENQFLSRETIALDEDGSGNVAAALYNSGEYKFRFLHWIRNESTADQKQALVSYLNLAAPEKIDLKLSDDIKSNLLQTGFDLSLEKIPAMKAGSKMFLNKHLFRIWRTALPTSNERTRDFYFEHPFEKSDTTVYQLPAGYTIESLPKPVHYEYKYAVYDSKTWKDETSGNIISVSSLTLNQHIIPVADFVATKKFFSMVIDDEIQRIVITR